MSRARELSRLGNPNIISADNDFNVGFGTLTPRAKGDFVGVVSATSFYGDGSSLTGVAAAGIGTAVSDDKTSPLNQLYYTNQTLDVGVTTTFDVPASAQLGYSQAAEIAVGSGADLIIADGDELITDILGISTAGTQTLTGTGGRVRTDTVTSRTTLSPVDFPSGITGVAATFTGNVTVGGTITYEDVQNVDSVGIVTAGKGLRVTTGGIVVTAGVSTFTNGNLLLFKVWFGRWFYCCCNCIKFKNFNSLQYW